VLALVGFVLAAFAAATPGALWPPGEWYAALAKPPWNPPSWVFGPVWSTLYALMAVAAWRILRAQGEGRRAALALWWTQLALNAGWTPLFFGWKRMDLALLEILALEAAILATTVRFLRLDRYAGVLLVPYAAWVAFAALLNFTLWRLNR
jgi:tryptophan-rich sensory protein